MYRLKKLLSICLASLMLLTLFAVSPLAAEDDNFIYIYGENIIRRADTAIIYRGIASTGQTAWGHDIVINQDWVVTDIIESGASEGENLSIPDGHTVISAAGNKVQWFKNNVKKGSKLFYDQYTKRLFVCDNKGDFDPYFSVEKSITGEGNYLISNPEISGTPTYTYDVAVNAEGTVVERGSNVTAPEGGFIISAATVSDKEFLITHTPLGSKCVVSEGVATFSYDKTMLQTTAELEIARSEEIFQTAKASFYYIDVASVEATVNEIKNEIPEKLDYKALVSILDKLESKVNRVCNDTDSNELRATFHTPNETDKTQVRKIVQTAKANGLNTLFLRVSNGYGTFIPLPESNRFKQDDKFGGFDLLEAYIEVCEKENIALGLSVDVYYNEYASIAASDWLTVTNGTETGLRDKYFSPASVGFKDHFIDYIEYIVSNYDISTVLLDYLRYPKFREDCDLGYDYDTIAGFAKEYSVPLAEAEAIKTQLFDSPHWQKWVEYRMSLVTDMAKSISDTIKSSRTDVNLIAISQRDSVDHFYMQDTLKWLEDGIIDGICLSFYERDALENDVIDQLAYDDGLVSSKGEIIGSYTGKNAFFFTAFEASKNLTPETLSGMMTESRNIGADGFVFSNLNDYVAQNYYVSLSNDNMANEALSPIAPTVETMKRTLEIAKDKINNSILANGGCDEDTASTALAKINDALLLLESSVLTHEQATTLESDIAIIFASSAAKQTVLKEFQAITKMALLYKEKTETEQPVTPPEESSTPEESDTSSETTSDTSETISTDSPIIEDKDEININVGNILIYAFVGITTIVAFVAIIIAIKRKNKRPANRHMPKASFNENENGNKEE